MPNPGDAITALASGAVQAIHNPFTNRYVAASKGAPVKIVAGSGAGGVVVIAQKTSGVRSVADLKKKVGTEFAVGSHRVNTLELTFYRVLANNGMKYDDFKMVWFTDNFALASAFQAGKIEVVTHVEPYSTQLVDQFGGVPLATNIEAWGKDAPDCVVSMREDFIKKYPDTTRRYLRAILKADRAIKADMAKAVEVLDKGKYYKVDADTLRRALPRQLPQVDLTDGAKAMEVAAADMLTLRYLTKLPEGVTDFALLREVLRG
jgi:ABC-type nitrate/sulfonate/bicarbonate transport system substrate-binding protein